MKWSDKTYLYIVIGYIIGFTILFFGSISLVVVYDIVRHKYGG